MRIDFAEQMSFERVEGLNDVLLDPEHTQNITLNIRSCRHAGLLGEGSLLGVLASAKEKKIPIYIETGGPCDDASYIGGSAVNTGLLRSISGLILVHYATKILDASEHDCSSAIRESQAEFIQKGHGLLISDEELAAPIIDDFGSPPASKLALEDDIRRFAALLRGLFSKLGLSPRSEKDTEAICDFAFQTFQNTRDHGTTDLAGEPIHGVRFLSIRRLSSMRDAIDRSKYGDNPVYSYLKAVREALKLQTIPAEQLVEMTIADSGVGIPARMAGSFEVYKGLIDTEKKQLQRAIERGTTSKPSTVLGAGLGLFNVMKAAYDLNGMIVFRTGRLCMYKHYLSDTIGWPSLYLERWREASLNAIRGTIVSLIFPWL